MGIYSKNNLYKTDEYGVDPLSSKFLKTVTSVTFFTEYTVEQNQASRPDLIAYMAYDDIDLWWVVLVYNKIVKVEELTTGRKIRLPFLGELSSKVMADILTSSNRLLTI